MQRQATLNTVYYLYPLLLNFFFGTGHVAFSEPQMPLVMSFYCFTVILSESRRYREGEI